MKTVCQQSENKELSNDTKPPVSSGEPSVCPHMPPIWKLVLPETCPCTMKPRRELGKIQWDT